MTITYPPEMLPASENGEVYLCPDHEGGAVCPKCVGGQMTDKWDEEAGRIAWEEWKPSSCARKIAQAQRNAEKAGMERAAVICEEQADGYVLPPPRNWDRTRNGLLDAADAIRALSPNDAPHNREACPACAASDAYDPAGASPDKEAK